MQSGLCGHGRPAGAEPGPRTCVPGPGLRALARNDVESIVLDRDCPDESQTGINVCVFPALLQDRREVLTDTNTSGNPNAWSRV
jgi:hypothetical protein